jgi:hypothetical protein
MAEKQKRWVIYYDDTLLKKMDRLREENAKKNFVPVEEVAVSDVVKAVVDEKYIEYVDVKNNRARITTLAESQDKVEKGLISLQDKMEKELLRLQLQVAQLTAAISALKGNQ